MPKPRWLREREAGAKRMSREPDMCFECAMYGHFVKMTRHRGGKPVEVHACLIHPHCFNTKYSICCDDFARL